MAHDLADRLQPGNPRHLPVDYRRCCSKSGAPLAAEPHCILPDWPDTMAMTLFRHPEVRAKRANQSGYRRLGY
jgi:hypothetical protein